MKRVVAHCREIEAKTRQMLSGEVDINDIYEEPLESSSDDGDADPPQEN